MIPSQTQSPVRRKAVWGPKRTVSALFVALALLVPNFAIAKTHSHEAKHKKPGVAGTLAKSYKLDDELTKRSTDRSSGLHKSRVIVTLAPGAKLPEEFKKFARGGNLSLINGQVLELTDNQLAKMAAHPSVFRIHHD